MRGGGPAPQLIRAMENLKLALRLRQARGPLSEEQINAASPRRSTPRRSPSSAADAGEGTAVAKLQAEMPTAHASRYLQQLCKHWSHRFAVEFDATHGVVHFDGADAVLDAEAQRLLLALEGGDRARLARLGEVVTEHLKRFAFREAVELRWREAETGESPR